MNVAAFRRTPEGYFTTPRQTAYGIGGKSASIICDDADLSQAIPAVTPVGPVVLFIRYRDEEDAIRIGAVS